MHELGGAIVWIIWLVLLFASSVLNFLGTILAGKILGAPNLWKSVKIHLWAAAGCLAVVIMTVLHFFFIHCSIALYIFIGIIFCWLGVVNFSMAVFPPSEPEAK